MLALRLLFIANVVLTCINIMYANAKITPIPKWNPIFFVFLLEIHTPIKVKIIEAKGYAILLYFSSS